MKKLNLNENIISKICVKNPSHENLKTTEGYKVEVLD